MRYKDLEIAYFSQKFMQDYLHDALFLGFNQLGCHVVDIPDKATLHGKRIEEQKHCEQLFFNFERKSLKKPRPDLMVIAAQLHPGNPVKHEQWKEFVKGQVKSYNPKHVVIVDGSDESEYSYPDIDTDFIFKRELPKKHDNSMVPINFAPIEESFEFVPFSQRRYDVSFMATISHPLRVRTKELLNDLTRKLGLSSHIYCERELRPREEYMRVLSQSKCFVSVQGYGKDCYRYWEIPMRGSVLISQDLDLDVWKDFGYSQCFKFKTEEDLKNVLLTIKNMDDSELQKMAIRGMLHVNQYHTPKKRADHILRTVFGDDI